MEDLLIYNDENDNKKTIFCEITNIGVSSVSFLTTHSNKITIPMNRVIKIKQKDGVTNE